MRYSLKERKKIAKYNQNSDILVSYERFLGNFRKIKEKNRKIHPKILTYGRWLGTILLSDGFI